MMGHWLDSPGSLFTLPGADSLHDCGTLPTPPPPRQCSFGACWAGPVTCQSSGSLLMCVKSGGGVPQFPGAGCSPLAVPIRSRLGGAWGRGLREGGGIAGAKARGRVLGERRGARAFSGGASRRVAAGRSRSARRGSRGGAEGAGPGRWRRWREAGRDWPPCARPPGLWHPSAGHCVPAAGLCCPTEDTR